MDWRLQLIKKRREAINLLTNRNSTSEVDINPDEKPRPRFKFSYYNTNRDNQPTTFEEKIALIDG